MKSFSHFVKKIVLLIIFVTFILMLNYKIVNGWFGEFINANFMDIILWTIKFATVVGGIIAVYDLLCFFSYRCSNKLWQDTQEETKIGLERYISTNLMIEGKSFESENDLQKIYYLWSYINGENVFDVLEYLKTEFENNEASQVYISYFLLSNQYDNNILEFLNEFPDFKKMCFSCSEKLVIGTTYKDNLFEFDLYMLRTITNELMHLSIASVSINAVEHIDYIRKVLSWACCQIRNKDLFANQEFKRFMLIIPKLEYKLLNIGIDDKMIHFYIKKLKKSFCLTKMIFDSVKQLRQLKIDLLEENVYDVGLLISYPEKFNLIYQLIIQRAVKKRRKLYQEQYHLYYRDTMTLLFMVIPLGCINNPDQDIADRILSIVNAFGELK